MTLIKECHNFITVLKSCNALSDRFNRASAIRARNNAVEVSVRVFA
jgi:hypothetical protein